MPMFPDASNTGVPSGTTLTPYTGSWTISTDNTIIEDKILDIDYLTVNASNVIIRRCEINFTGSWGILAETAVGLLVEDCTITGPGVLSPANTCFLGNGTLRRCNLSQAENGVVCQNSVTIQDCYIHDLNNPGATPHVDGISIQGGNFDTLIEGNTILAWDTSCIFMNDDFGSVDGVIIRNNFLGNQPGFNPCASAIYIHDPTTTNVEIYNNYICKGSNDNPEDPPYEEYDIGYFSIHETTPDIHDNVLLSSTTTLEEVNSNYMAGSSSINFSATGTISGGIGTMSIWDHSTETGGSTELADTSWVNLGVVFRSSVDGLITHISFVKTAENTSTSHEVALWFNDGSLLASGSVTGLETGTRRWVDVPLNTPVAITAGLDYVASILLPGGLYPATAAYFNTEGTTRGPLHALHSHEYGTDNPGNGRYSYNTALAYPDQTFNSTNYWVDVLFEADATESPISGSSSLNLAATGTLKGTGKLSGIINFNHTAVGILKGSGKLSGTSDLVYSTNGILSGTGELIGLTGLQFDASGTLASSQTHNNISGSAALGFSGTGILLGSGRLAGESNFGFDSSGLLGAEILISGRSRLTFSSVGILRRSLFKGTTGRSVNLFRISSGDNLVLYPNTESLILIIPYSLTEE